MKLEKDPLKKKWANCYALCKVAWMYGRVGKVFGRFKGRFIPAIVSVVRAKRKFIWKFRNKCWWKRRPRCVNMLIQRVFVSWNLKEWGSLRRRRRRRKWRNRKNVSESNTYSPLFPCYIDWKMVQRLSLSTSEQETVEGSLSADKSFGFKS